MTGAAALLRRIGGARHAVRLLAALLLALPVTLAAAEQRRVLDVARMLPGDFAWHPERAPQGPVGIVVSLPEQRVHVYRNGVRIAVSTTSTGTPGHCTPTGTFTVLEKDKDHYSSTYDRAPMPNMLRITWPGVALHAGPLPGYPASHGCIRLPFAFSELLWEITHLGTPVIVTGDAGRRPGLMLDPDWQARMEGAVARRAGRPPPGWENAPESPATTLLVTGGDGRLTLLRGGRAILESAVAARPLGERVFLSETGPDGTPTWRETTLLPPPEGTAPGLPPLDVRADLPERIAAFRHPGMTVVLSDLPRRPENGNPVLMEGALLAVPRPRPRPAS